MYRSLIASVLAALIVTLEAAHPISANQAVDAFKVSKSQLVDVQQETLQETSPESKRTTEVFPGTFVSPYGVLMMKRIEDLFARVGEADRATLLKENIGAGFDRSITSWRAHPDGRRVALAVQLLSQSPVAAPDGIVGRLWPARASRSCRVRVLHRRGLLACGRRHAGPAAKRNSRPWPRSTMWRCRRTVPAGMRLPKNSWNWCCGNSR